LFLVVFGFVAVGFFFLLHPSGRAVFFPPLAAHRSGRRLTRILIITFAVCLIGNFLVLLTISSADVRSDEDEIGFYLAITAVWLVLTVVGFEYLGISFRDDVASRRNSAAAATICGLMAGEAFCLAGSHTGNGPGPEVVFACAAISTATLFVAWILLDAFSGIVERVSVERDFAGGIRGAGFLGGCGAILGASVAGDWISLERTLRGFVRFCWPILGLLLLTIGVERVIAKRRSNRRSGIYFSAVYGGIVFFLGVIYAVRVWGRG
jgi:hypothetical protein